MPFLLFSLLFLFVSCNDSVEDCSVDLVSAKSDLEQEFLKINSVDPDLSTLATKLQSYLDTFDDKKCKIDGENFYAHTEVKSLLSEINSVKSKVQVKVVYGDDNRVDVVDYPDSEVQTLASSVAAMVPEDNIDSSGNLSGDTLGDAYGLCEDQKFRDEKVSAVCTGFLVDDDLLVTAGHCVGEVAVCGTEKWVFGYHNNTDKVDPNDVYECSSVVSHSYSNSTWLDYAVIKLDRKVTSRKPLRFRRSGLASVGDDLIIMGHPTGISLKIADDASVRSLETEYFVANLDSFGGNSGSPVFNASTKEVEGILVRGETDYKNGDGCVEVNTCEQDGCDGEESTFMSVVGGLDQFKALGVNVDYTEVYDSEASESTGYFPLAVVQKKGFDYNLAGKKFLDVCLAHVYEKETGVMTETSEFECSVSNFQNIYEKFVVAENL